MVKMGWLREEDKNTIFFHSKASNRKKRNVISKLKEENGNWQLKEEDIGRILTDYCRDLFQTSNPFNSESMMNVVDTCITLETNLHLTKKFTQEEVFMALQQMHLIKALIFDGISLIFYQKCWHIAGPYVAETMLNILDNKVNSQALNHTFIILIPKINSLENPTHFQSINLCNVIFKIVIKIIANRFKSLLCHIIYDTQKWFCAK